MILMNLPTLKDVEEAKRCLTGVAERTGLIHNKYLCDMTGAEVYLKPENLQMTGSFKLRGAYNRIAHLTDDEKKKGVVSSSAGNHAQGVAYAATKFGVKSTIVMPKPAPISKIKATKALGAEVVLCGDIYDEAYQKALDIQHETGAVFVHPFDDPMVMAGQGTIGMEILEDLPDADIVICPIGGGGLISGLAVALKSLKPSVKVIGVQTANAQSMYRSFKAGKLDICDCKPTLADGISVKVPGDITFEVVKKYLDDIVLVSEDEIADAMFVLLSKAKIVAEGAGAVPTAAILNNHVDVKGKKVVSLVSGGNIDMDRLADVIKKGLSR